MLQLSASDIVSKETALLEQFRKLIELYPTTVKIYEDTRIANVGWLMQLVSRAAGVDLVDESAIRYLITLYSICEQKQIHDCYSAVSEPGCLYFFRVCLQHGLLDGI